MAAVNGLSKYQSVLKRVRREHPTWSFKKQQAEASRLNKSGKKVSGAKKKISAPKVSAAVGKVKRKKAVASPRKSTTRTTAKKTSSLQKARSLVNRINKLEIKRKEEKARELKDIIQLEINKCHDQLDAMKRRSKRRAA